MDHEEEQREEEEEKDIEVEERRGGGGHFLFWDKTPRGKLSELVEGIAAERPLPRPSLAHPPPANAQSAEGTRRLSKYGRNEQLLLRGMDTKDIGNKTNEK